MNLKIKTIKIDFRGNGNPDEELIIFHLIDFRCLEVATSIKPIHRINTDYLTGLNLFKAAIRNIKEEIFGIAAALKKIKNDFDLSQASIAWDYRQLQVSWDGEKCLSGGKVVQIS